jgi:hypothetical protein
MSLAGWSVMISMATSDPSFSVEAKYYQKAARFEEELALRDASRKLGWYIEVIEFRREADGSVLLEARLTDRDSLPLAQVGLAVEAMANLRGGDVRSVSASTDDAGRVSLRLAAGAPGLWELRFHAERGVDRFSQVIRRDLTVLSGASG